MWEVRFEGEEPLIPIDLGGEQLNGTRDNLHLYTFSPNFEEMNHLYFVKEKKKQEIGMYIFRSVIPDFDTLVKLMSENHYWHIHGKKPSDKDIEVFVKLQTGDIDEKPDWLN